MAEKKSARARRLDDRRKAALQSRSGSFGDGWASAQFLPDSNIGESASKAKAAEAAWAANPRGRRSYWQ